MTSPTTIASSAEGPHGRPPRRFSSIDALEREVGREIAASPWHQIDQALVDAFADATGDRQWIHVDPGRARQGPYGGTIAHGYLTLSLLPVLMDAAVQLEHQTMGVNYGLEKVRFPAPVPVGSRIRLRITLRSIQRLPAIAGVPGAHIVWEMTVECEGSAKPVCVAQTVNRRWWGAPRAPEAPH